LLQNQATVLGISHAVRFLGFQESAEAFMKSCAIGVIASIGSEEISRACLEWFAVGRPVVGTLVGSIPELIEPDETGFLVAPNDSAALAHAILTLLRAPHQKEVMGRKAHQQALSKYSASRQKEQLLAVYENSTH
jgi:glycosyltransferase involved in cell wall biosynthesis